MRPFYYLRPPHTVNAVLFDGPSRRAEQERTSDRAAREREKEELCGIEGSKTFSENSGGTKRTFFFVATLNVDKNSCFKENDYS